MLEPGFELFKLAAKKNTKEIYDSMDDDKYDKYGSKDKLKNDILKLSVKYQVLTKETAFIGVIKQEDKVVGELKKVTIPTVLATYDEP